MIQPIHILQKPRTQTSFSKRCAQSGFTLTEVLIAMAILAGIAAAIAPALNGAFKASGRIHLAAAKTEDMRIFDQVMGRVFTGIVRVSIDEAETLFIGTPQNARFLSFGIDQADPSWIELSIDRDRRIMELRSHKALEARSQSRDKPAPVILVRDADIRFRYFGKADKAKDAETATWHDSWRSDRPPYLVRMIIASDNSDTSSVKFDFVMQARAPLNCRFDPVSRRCRDT